MFCDVAPGLSHLSFTPVPEFYPAVAAPGGQAESELLPRAGLSMDVDVVTSPGWCRALAHTSRKGLPPVSICAHLQMHRSLSASLVLKSLPGWLMLLILPADPVRPFRWILGAWRGEEGDERGFGC